MKVFDKAQWHIDGGENKTDVIAKFVAVFDFLKSENLLNANGMEIFDLGIDSSVSLNESLLTEAGKTFVANYYDKIINLPATKIAAELKKFL